MERKKTKDARPRRAKKKGTRTPAPGSRAEAKPYRVDRSGIHGRGVFAARLIRRGTRLLEYRGEIVGAEEAERRARSSKHVYIFDLENGKFIDGDPRSDAARVNHSCDPNCVVDVVGDRVFVVADRTIRKGEELTYDYSFDADTDLWLCACGTKRCRGTINLKTERKTKVVRDRSRASKAARKSKRPAR